MIGLLLVGCTSQNTVQRREPREEWRVVKEDKIEIEPEKTSRSEWRIEDEIQEEIISLSENGGIEVFGKNPVKVVSSKDYETGNDHLYYYVIMHMAWDEGYFMDYVALKGLVGNGVIEKENINIIESLDFAYGNTRELYLITSNVKTKYEVSKTFDKTSERFEIIDFVKIDDRLFEDKKSDGGF